MSRHYFDKSGFSINCECVISRSERTVLLAFLSWKPQKDFFLINLASRPIVKQRCPRIWSGRFKNSRILFFCLLENLSAHSDRNLSMLTHPCSFQVTMFNFAVRACAQSLLCFALLLFALHFIVSYPNVLVLTDNTR